MVKTLILYESKYGFTEGIARNLSLVLGPAFCCRTSQFKENWEEYDFIVICAPINSDAADAVFQYVLKNQDIMNKKRVVLLGTCPYEAKANQYLESLKCLLGECVVFDSAIEGEGTTEKFIELSQHIKELKDQNIIALEDSTLNQYIDDFINSHNTCALATGYDRNIRATPIEYTYMNGFIYILSEGGEKFANLIINKNVSLCIFNEFKGMNDLGGMQITGNAEFIDIGTDEYNSFLQQKGLNLNKIISMPIFLNLIKIKIRKIEFLWSDFSRAGYDVKQIAYRF
jgi:Flavodoxin